MAKEFSALKIGYRGDLWFSTVETIDVPAFLHGEIISQKQLTSGEAWSALFNKTESPIDDIHDNTDLITFCKTPRTRQEISDYLDLKTVYFVTKKYN